MHGWPVDLLGGLVDLLLLPLLLIGATAARFLPRDVDVGLGPEPFNSYLTHRDALERQGYRARTYVNHVYYVTSGFDVELRWPGPLRYLAKHALFLWAVTRCRCLFLSFSGGALGSTRLAWRIEPLLYRLAGQRIVMLPYGGDIQDMSRCPNLRFKDAMGRDYPDRRMLRAGIAARVDLWTRWADHVVAGCEWVDFLYHWDSLMLLHFPVDTERWAPPPDAEPPGIVTPARPLRVVHAPNHPHIKGTAHFERAVRKLAAEGVPVELRVLRGVSNDEIRAAIAAADVVADQLIMGWYAMFALEAMAMGKPVLCSIREDLEELYQSAGLLEPGELPLARCDPDSVEQILHRLAKSPERRAEIGKRSREFVERRHSLEAVGRQMAAILTGLGLRPRTSAERPIC